MIILSPILNFERTSNINSVINWTSNQKVNNAFLKNKINIFTNNGDLLTSKTKPSILYSRFFGYYKFIFNLFC